MLTDHHTDDRACILSIMDQSNVSYITDFLADGGYDSHQIYETLEEQNIKPFIPPPKQAIIHSETNLSKRYKAVKHIKDKGSWALVLQK